MDVKYVNPFVESFSSVMPEMGFGDVQLGKLSIKSKEVVNTGVIIVLGIVGAVKGNVVYTMGLETARQMASTIMMGMPVDEFDDMAKSALSELTNMLTANAATNFSKVGVSIDISTPTMLQGINVSVKMGSEQILCVELFANGLPVYVNIAFEN